MALTYSRAECRKLTRMLLKQTGAKNMEELAALSEERLRAINEKLNESNNFPERDGVILPEDPYGAYEKGEAFPVQMMIGTNADELRYWILDLGSLFKYRIASHVLVDQTMRRLRPEDRKCVRKFLAMQPGRLILDRPWKSTEFFNELLFRLPALRQAQALAARGNTVYTYYWSCPSSIPRLGACHAVELAYVFNNLRETIYTDEGICEPLARKVQQMWVNFAKTGDPDIEDVHWAPYTEKSRASLILDREIRTEEDLKARQRELLAPLLDYYINGNV